MKLNSMKERQLFQDAARRFLELSEGVRQSELEKVAKDLKQRQEKMDQWISSMGFENPAHQHLERMKEITQETGPVFRRLFPKTMKGDLKRGIGRATLWLDLYYVFPKLVLADRMMKKMKTNDDLQLGPDLEEAIKKYKARQKADELRLDRLRTEATIEKRRMARLDAARRLRMAERLKKEP